MPSDLTFLVVRRESRQRESTARDLERFGSVVTAPSFQDARSLLRSMELHAIVVDVELEGGTGLGIADLASAHRPGVITLAIADTIDHELATRALEAGIEVCLAPFTERHAIAFANHARAKQTAFDRRVTAVLERWKTRFRLTPVEEEMLHRAARGDSREQMARRRKVTVETIRKQVQTLLRKTHSDSFGVVVGELLREAATEPI